MDMETSGRRRLRLSVRAMLVVILGVGLWLGYLANGARRQQRAVAKIRAYGGFAHYDFEMVNGAVVPGRVPRGPRWLRERLGIDYFATVTDVNLVFEGAGTKQVATERKDPEVMSAVRDLSGLKSLLIHEGQATDDSLAMLRGLGALEELNIARATELTDAGLAHLSGLTGLKRLSIGGSGKLTDAGLAHLAGLRRLQYLYLWPGGDSITDAGLLHLAGMTDLEELTIFNATIGDVGLDRISRFEKLKELHLTFGTYRFTDRGMASLGRLKRLSTLDLQGENLPGRGLVQLGSLPSLRQLWLALKSPLVEHDTAVFEGVEALKRANPNIAVR